MPKLILTRTHILEDSIKGFLTIEGTSFSCYTIEAACPYGQHPLNRIFRYALDCGEYKLKLMPYKYYPLFPFIEAKPYKNISLVNQEQKVPRAGCISIGTKFATEHFLIGFEVVADALRDMIYTNYTDWKAGHNWLEIKDDPELQTVYDEYDEDDDTDGYNFAGV